MKYLFWVIILAYIVLHIPFINCDPPVLLDLHTRGAWTDEGLYTSQIRNYINHNYFHIKENTTFIRGPLFNLVQLPFFLLFGVKLAVSRLVVLGVTVFALFQLSKLKQYKFLAITFFLITFLEFHVFSFAHTSMSEMMSIAFILIGFYYLMKAYASNEINKVYIFLSALSAACAYYAKIQFLYVVLVFGLATLLIALLESYKTKRFKSNYLTIFYWHALFSSALAVLYGLAWYLPNKQFYNYVMTAEADERFPVGFMHIIENAYWFFNYFFINQEAELKLLFLVILVVGIICFFLFKIDKFQRNTYYTFPVIFAVSWILIESHKLAMVYIPFRYLLGLIVAIGLLLSSLLAPMLDFKNTLQRYFAYLFIGLVVFFNMQILYTTYKNRTWQMHYANEYFSKFNFKKAPVIGPWAASFTWGNKAITFPTWNNYLNYADPLKTIHPRIVITETDQTDTDSLYARQGIDLNKMSDSSRLFIMRKHEIMVYWIKQKQ